MKWSCKAVQLNNKLPATLLPGTALLAVVPTSAAGQVSQCQHPSLDPPTAKFINNTPNITVLLQKSDGAGCPGSDANTTGSPGQQGRDSQQTNLSSGGVPRNHPGAAGTDSIHVDASGGNNDKTGKSLHVYSTKGNLSFAGAVGTSGLQVDGAVHAQRQYHHRIRVQSIGGGTQSGSTFSLFCTKGKPSAHGGNAGKVTIPTGQSANIRVSGPGSAGFLAQGIGGGVLTAGTLS